MLKIILNKRKLNFGIKRQINKKIIRKVGIATESIISITSFLQSFSLYTLEFLAHFDVYERSS